MGERLNCVQCSKRPGLLVSMPNGEQLCFDCYKKWLRPAKGSDGEMKRKDLERISVVFEEGVSAR